MAQHKNRRIATEAVVLALGPAAASLLSPGDPGFLSLLGGPALAVGPLFAAFYGLGWGAAVALLSAVLSFIAAPALEGALDPAYLASAAAALRLPATVSFAALVGAGLFRNRMVRSRAVFLGRYRLAVHRNAVLARKANALEKVNRVLENRVSGQRDSITILHNQVRKLASLNLDRALDTILETVELFTDTRSSSIWVADPASALLVPAAVRGWTEGEERDTTLDPESSIEGYVLRNGKPFSVRMILDSSEFDRFEGSRNVITMPILVKEKPWGVLTIEDLPFERYSLYTESILEILLSLAEPYLRDIVEYEFLHARSEVDPDTGFPQYSVLWETLGKELERRAYEPGFVSLVVVEMANFEEGLLRWPRPELKRLLFRIHQAFEEASGGKYQAFHFKSDSQFAFLAPSLDQDGASFLCLDLLTTCSGLQLTIGDEVVPIEMIVGFASAGSGDGPDAMVESAEHLLSIQRL